MTGKPFLFFSNGKQYNIILIGEQKLGVRAVSKFLDKSTSKVIHMVKISHFFLQMQHQK